MFPAHHVSIDAGPTSTKEGSRVHGGDLGGMTSVGEAGLKVDKWAVVKWSSSFEDRRGNRAGVGAGKGHGRTWSTSTSDSSSVGSSSSLGVPRPAVVRRTSSFEGRNAEKRELPRPPPMGGIKKGLENKHTRTASEPTETLATLAATRASSVDQGIRTTSVTPSFMSSFEGGIKLGSDKDLPTTTRLLFTLHALTPPSRTPMNPVPPPTSGILHPNTLLTPLAIILEALVTERSVLRGEISATTTSPNSPPRLPVLRDGSSLQLNHEGEIDWNNLRSYIIALGQILSQLMPYLRPHPDRNQVEGLTKGLRVYVGKQKKVFGEIATMYVEGYSFVRGWWDEMGMKKSASEVGKWGDLFDA